jgi:RHS repeat-associated protein
LVVFQPRPAPVAAHGVFFNTLLTLVALPDHSQAWVTNQQKSQLSPGFEILGTIPLPNAKAQIEVTLADSTPHVLVLGELLGLFIPQFQPFTPGFDPENGLTSELTAPEITQPVFYIYDHLGNTRATYHVDITCPSTKVYVLEYASEYYPYGKTLRDYTLGAVKEKYETTQHERDQETGLDYRGARFYDSDVARFLTVDPLEDKYPNLSPYNYVGNNPINNIDINGDSITPVGHGQHLRMGLINWDKGVPAGNGYTLYGGTGTNSSGNATQMWVARMDGDGWNVPEGMHRDDWVMNVTDVKEFRDNSSHYKYLANTINLYENGSKSIWKGYLDVIANPYNWIGGASVYAAGTFGKLPLVQRNRNIGNAFRDEVANVFGSQGRLVVKEVHKRTPFGSRYIDIEVTNSNGKILGGVETKVGNSPYTLDQKARDFYLKKVNNYPVNVIRKKD